MWRYSLLLRRCTPCRALALGKDLIMPRVPTCRRPDPRQKWQCGEYWCAESGARQRSSLPRAVKKPSVKTETLDKAWVSYSVFHNHDTGGWRSGSRKNRRDQSLPLVHGGDSWWRHGFGHKSESLTSRSYYLSMYIGFVLILLALHMVPEYFLWAQVSGDGLFSFDLKSGQVRKVYMWGGMPYRWHPWCCSLYELPHSRYSFAWIMICQCLCLVMFLLVIRKCEGYIMIAPMFKIGVYIKVG
jgi:hypothetical protein